MKRIEDIPRLRVISLGAGVQSTTMALMAAHGELGPMPDCAIFADTGDEPLTVENHLSWLATSGVLPFPVAIVKHKNAPLSEFSLRAKTSKNGRKYIGADIPIWIRQENGSIAPGARSCTRDFKIIPIRRKIKQLLGITNRLPKSPVCEQWIGISTDEGARAKPSQVSYIENRFPLIEAGMSRNDCLRWLEKNGYPRAPRSACFHCPYHSNAEWVRIKREEPVEWQRAVDYERKMKQVFQDWDEALRGEPFLWQGGELLEDASFSDENQWDLFVNECEGMCGV